MIARLLILSLLSAILAVAAHVNTASNAQNGRIDKLWRDQKKSCEQGAECSPIHPDENANCVNKCISASCYEQIYAEEPLEDGEIDHRRNRDFINCLRKVFKVIYHYLIH